MKVFMIGRHDPVSNDLTRGSRRFPMIEIAAHTEESAVVWYIEDIMRLHGSPTRTPEGRWRHRMIGNGEILALPRGDTRTHRPSSQSPA
jgi:hypothetical protein